MASQDIWGAEGFRVQGFYSDVYGQELLPGRMDTVIQRSGCQIHLSGGRAS